MDTKTIKRALISVYNKTGVVEFVRTLVSEFGIEIISTGGTATLLEENDIPVTRVEQVTDETFAGKRIRQFCWRCARQRWATSDIDMRCCHDVLLLSLRVMAIPEILHGSTVHAGHTETNGGVPGEDAGGQVLVVYDGAMDSSFRHPSHEQFLKRQAVIGKTFKQRWGIFLVFDFKSFGSWIDTFSKSAILLYKVINARQ